MNQTQENKLTRGEAVLDVLTENSVIVTTNLGLKNAKLELETEITNIKNKDAEKIGVLTGKAQDKYDKEDELTDMTLAICGAMYACGKATVNNQLSETGKVERSRLRNMRDTQLVTFCKDKYNVASANSAALLDYGVTPLFLTDYDTLINDFDAATSSREGAHSTKKGMTSSLKQLFKEKDETLESISRLTEMLKKDHPEFYEAVQAAMVIKNLGESSGVWVGEILKGETKTVLNSPTITNTTKFKLTNRGTTDLQVLLNTTGLPGAGGVVIHGGEEVTKLASELGEEGSTYLIITNLSPTDGGRWRVKRYIGS